LGKRVFERVKEGLKIRVISAHNPIRFNAGLGSNAS
jgi:hypothetical protein